MDGNWQERLAAGTVEPLEGLLEAYSGASLQRVRFDDGATVVLKRLAPKGDWLTRTTGGTGRLRRMWEENVFDRVGARLDHTILDVVTDGDQDVVVMRDASGELFAPRGPWHAADVTQVLAGLATMHEVCAGVEVPLACGVGQRYAIFDPRSHQDDGEPGAHPVAPLIRAGWDTFAEVADSDLVDAVSLVHRDTSLLDAAVAGCERTLVHGDTKPANVGLSRAGRAVVIDWADISGSGPREVDVCWFALMATREVGGDPAALIDTYEQVSGRPLDPVALDAATVGSLAQMGFALATFAFQGDDDQRARTKPLFDFWCSRTRDALERLSLTA